MSKGRQDNNWWKFLAELRKVGLWETLLESEWYEPGTIQNVIHLLCWHILLRYSAKTVITAEMRFIRKFNVSAYRDYRLVTKRRSILEVTEGEN